MEKTINYRFGVDYKLYTVAEGKETLEEKTEAGLPFRFLSGFGMVLDGSQRVDDILRTSMPWDVMGGVARRAWARNENSITTAMEYNKMCEGKDHLTLPFIADDEMIDKLVGDKEFE